MNTAANTATPLETAKAALLLHLDIARAAGLPYTRPDALIQLLAAGLDTDDRDQDTAREFRRFASTEHKARRPELPTRPDADVIAEMAEWGAPVSIPLTGVRYGDRLLPGGFEIDGALNYRRHGKSTVLIFREDDLTPYAREFNDTDTVTVVRAHVGGKRPHAAAA